MSIRHIDALFAPASVAIFGAKLRQASVGGTVWRNLLADFKGRLHPVNPKQAERDSVATFANLAALPEAPDLAVPCTPPATVAWLVAELESARSARRSRSPPG
jgi:acetyltransferase